MQASDILSLSPDILRCAVLDDAGRILSKAESESGRNANLPSHILVTVKALTIQGLADGLPKELGKVKYTMVVSDRYRLLTMVLKGRTVMFALPLCADPAPICEAALKRFG